MFLGVQNSKIPLFWDSQRLLRGVITWMSWSIVVDFIRINTFLLHEQLPKVKGFGAIWGLKQQNFTFGGLTVTAVGEFSWVSWSIEANFSKINTFLLHKQVCKANGLGAIYGQICYKTTF